jgi:NAD(P)-dependent dehydrogenase (short-subunit alcohol dehydrogenase family)
MKRHLDLAGRPALVTGGGRGIGAAVAAELTRRGARVALVDIDAATVQATAAAIGGDTIGLTADVRDGDAMAAAVAEANERLGPLEVVVANAGVTPPPATVRTITPADFHRVLDINISGVFNTVQPALDSIIAGHGHVHVVASVAAFAPGVGGATYMMSKAAIEQFGRALRLELAPLGASVGTTYFGVVDTDMARDMFEGNPLGKRVESLLTWPLNVRIPAEDAANTMVDAIEHRKPRTISPKVWAPYSVLRGVANPLMDWHLARSRMVADLLTDIEAQRRELDGTAPAVSDARP